MEKNGKERKLEQYLVEMIHGRTGSTLLHVLLLADLLGRRDFRVVECAFLVAAVGEAASDADRTDCVLVVFSRDQFARDKSVTLSATTTRQAWEDKGQYQAIRILNASELNSNLALADGST